MSDEPKAYTIEQLRAVEKHIYYTFDLDNHPGTIQYIEEMEADDPERLQEIMEGQNDKD